MKPTLKLLFLPALGMSLSSCLLPHKMVSKINHMPQSETITRICFGSCGSQNKPQPILRTVVKEKPDLFIYLGDNIYANTNWMPLLRWKYRKLAVKPEFQQLRDSCPLLATWDDHDYGYNDSGAEFKAKYRSKKVFMKFWNEPQSSSRRMHKGIYDAYTFGKGDRKVQIILLDLRTFRSRALPAIPGKNPNDYRPSYDSTATMMGEEQWGWLRAQLMQPAALRIICSSTQFATEYNGYEAWANFPLQQARMLRLIRETRAEGVLFISGDVHYGEISSLKEPGMYTVYDVTSSGITEIAGVVEPNKYRIGQAHRSLNFGELRIDWDKPGAEISMSVRDLNGAEKAVKVIRLDELKW